MMQSDDMSFMEPAEEEMRMLGLEPATRTLPEGTTVMTTTAPMLTSYSSYASSPPFSSFGTERQLLEKPCFNQLHHIHHQEEERQRFISTSTALQPRRDPQRFGGGGGEAGAAGSSRAALGMGMSAGSHQGGGGWNGVLGLGRGAVGQGHPAPGPVPEQPMAGPHWLAAGTSSAAQARVNAPHLPLSAAFVGSEPDHRHAFVDAAVDTSSYVGFPPSVSADEHWTSHAPSFWPQHLPEYYEQQQHIEKQATAVHHAHNDFVYSSLQPVPQPIPQHFHSYGHPMEQQQLQPQHVEEQFQLADISTSTISATSTSEMATSSSMLFEPLSVCSSACTWSSGAEEFSSQSQDEILEEIQRECSEIERRSFSRSPQSSDAEGTKKSPRGKAAGTSSKSGTRKAGKAPRKKDRAERKKELNRVAATRYREKKRKEQEEMAGEMGGLQTRNTELKTQIAAVQAEMDYLKGLLKEIEAARRIAKQ